MGNIYATNELELVANLVPQFTIYSMTFAMIMSRHQGLGWIMPPFFLMGYSLIVRQAFNVQNPLQIYVGVDYDQAAVIMNCILVIFSAGFAFFGQKMMMIIGAKELMPVGRALPSLSRKSSDIAVLTVNGDDSVTVDEAEYIDGTGTSGLTSSTTVPARPRPTWMHFFGTFCYFLVCTASQITYDQVIRMTGDEWIAWVVLLAGPTAATVLYLIFCLVYTDAGIFGHTKSSLSASKDTHNLDSSTVDKIIQKTRSQVIWSIVPIGAFTLLGNLAVGGARIVTPDVDPNWLVALGVWAGFMLILIIVYFVLRSQYNPLSRKCKSGKNGQINDSADNYYFNATPMNLSSQSDMALKSILSKQK